MRVTDNEDPVTRAQGYNAEGNFYTTWWTPDGAVTTHDIIDLPMRTTPTSDVGAATENGMYTWGLHDHQGTTHPDNPFHTVQLETIDGKSTLPTTTPNNFPTFVGQFIQNGIDVHPPLPYPKFGSKNPWTHNPPNLDGGVHHGYSTGCHLVYPNSMGRAAIEWMRESVPYPHNYELNTSANAP